MPARKKSDDLVTPLIHSIRGQRVILDVDLARLYGVPTSQFNQAVKRNRRRFPSDFAFQLATAEPAVGMRSQSVTSSSQEPVEMDITSMRSQFVIASRGRRNVRHRPWAFTEHGALMAANILRSPRALEMSIYVIRAFVRMRETLATNAAILKRLAEIDKTLLVHDSALRDVYRKLLPLLSPPPDRPKPKIGFHQGNR